MTVGDTRSTNENAFRCRAPPAACSTSCFAWGLRAASDIGVCRPGSGRPQDGARRRPKPHRRRNERAGRRAMASVPAGGTPRRRAITPRLVRHHAIPQILAFGYFQLSWMLHAVQPTWSYRLNADFEDHAEHEYALAVQENHAWETTPVRSSFDADFGRYESLAELSDVEEPGLGKRRFHQSRRLRAASWRPCSTRCERVVP